MIVENTEDGLYNGIKKVVQSEYFVKGDGLDDRIYACPNDLFVEHPFIKGFDEI